MLEINGLVKHYGDFTLNCTMKVEPGRITGLVGENGAGKSTTFKAVLGLITYDAGDVALMGKAPSELTEEEKQKIGVTLAESGFSGYLKVKDVVPVLTALYPAFDREKFLGLCRKFGIPMDKYIREFSTGMKAKLKVLAAVTHRADFLLMDEPTTGLDVMAREGILDLFREYMEEDENRSILISSHISSDLEKLCDYIAGAGVTPQMVEEEKQFTFIADVMDSLISEVITRLGERSSSSPYPPSSPTPASSTSPSPSLPFPADSPSSAPSSRLVAAPFPYHHCPACARRDPAAYCPFCDLYIGYRVLKVESQLLYKTYEEVQQLARYLETHARVISDISKEAKSGM